VPAGGALRAARFRLAQVLADDAEARDEAREQFRLALGAAGDDPPDWRIHGDLGRLEQAADDQATALRHWLRAVGTAPDADVGEPAEHALALLDGVQGDAVDEVLADVDFGALRRRAGAADAPAPLVRLVTAALLRRGDAVGAFELFSGKPERGLPPDDNLSTERRLAYVASLVDADRWDDALAAMGPPNDAAGAAEAGLRGLLLYGADKPGEAWEALKRGERHRSFDQAVLRCLILLRRAAEAPLGEQRRELAIDALAAASDATQLGPTRPDTSLLRAEVMLEGGLDLNEGRRLLRRALWRLGDDLGSLSWWRAQERVRHDEVYAYFRIELAAAADRDDEVLARAAAATRVTTEFLQDGALSELEAGARQRRGDAADAILAYRTASNGFLAAGARVRAVDALEQALELEGPGPAALDLVEQLVEVAMAGGQEGLDVESAVTRALGHLTAVDGVLTGPDAVRACFLTGVTLARRAAERDARPPAAWRPLPHLLVAALAEEGFEFRPANLAWALMQAHLWYAARYFGEQAFAATEPPNPWITETAIVTGCNWTGEVDDTTRSRLAAAELDKDWTESILGLGHLLAEDRARLCDEVDRMVRGDFWARLAQAHATARCGDPKAAIARFTAIVKDASAAGDAEAVLDAALMLGDLGTAREQLAAGIGAAAISRCTAGLWAGLVDVLDGVDGAAADFSVVARRADRPLDLRSFGVVQIPSLLEIAPLRPGVAEVLERLRSDCLDALDRIPLDPPLDVELTHGWAGCADRDLQETVHRLLAAAELLRAGDRAAAATALREVARRCDPTPEAFARTLDVASARLNLPADALPDPG
jgi:tetratricopeptide (TPR) repeat protein